jgi:hypothetical protein
MIEKLVTNGKNKKILVLNRESRRNKNTILEHDEDF